MLKVGAPPNIQQAEYLVLTLQQRASQVLFQVLHILQVTLRLITKTDS